jgi:hypothetical protein
MRKQLHVIAELARQWLGPRRLTMEDGVNQSYERLDELLAGPRARA